MGELRVSDERSDMEIALDLAFHIENPCVSQGEGCATRHFYLDLAKEMIEKRDIKEPHAVEALSCLILAYSEAA